MGEQDRRTVISKIMTGTKSGVMGVKCHEGAEHRGVGGSRGPLSVIIPPRARTRRRRRSGIDFAGRMDVGVCRHRRTRSLPHRCQWNPGGSSRPTSETSPAPAIWRMSSAVSSRTEARAAGLSASPPMRRRRRRRSQQRAGSPPGASTRRAQECGGTTCRSRSRRRTDRKPPRCRLFRVLNSAPSATSRPSTTRNTSVLFPDGTTTFRVV